MKRELHLKISGKWFPISAIINNHTLVKELGLKVKGKVM